MSVNAPVQIDRQRIRELIEREEKRLNEATPKSAETYRRAHEVLSGGVASSYQLRDPWPIYLERGEGPRVWDVDGNEYLDFHNGFGSLVQGHAHPAIGRALQERYASGTHFAALAMTEAAQIKVIHAPLGSGKRIPSVLRGEVEMISVPTPEVAAHVKAGEVRILAVPSDAADPAFPGVPTLRQVGVPVAMELFRGLSVPKGTPPAVVEALASAFQKAAQDDTFRTAGVNGGYVVAVQGPAEFRTYLAEQDALIADLVRKAGLKK